MNYNNTIHSLIKLPPVKASLKKNESFVEQNLRERGNKLKGKFHSK